MSCTEVKRNFYDTEWTFDEFARSIEIKLEADGKTIDTITKDGVPYSKADDTGTVFAFGADKERVIYRTDDGFKWKDREGNWSLHDTDGRTLSYGNKNDVSVYYIYDVTDADRVVGIADNSGAQVLWYEYDADGNVVSVRDKTDRSVSYEYEGGKLVRVTNLRGHDTHYKYDAEGRLIEKREPGGKERYIYYSGTGHVESVSDENGDTIRFDYDYDKAKKEYYSSVIYKNGRIKERWFDSLGREIRTKINGELVSRKIYSDRSEIIEDRYGNQKRKDYDEWRNLLKTTYPDGTSVSYEYKLGRKAFNKVKKTDELGVVTTYEYDDSDNLVKMIEAMGTDVERVSIYTYDDAGNQRTYTVRAKDGSDEAVIEYRYDENGNMVKLIDAKKHETEYSYDIMGNPVERIDAEDKLWKYAYDEAGNLTMVTDPLENETSYEYNAQGLKSKEINAEKKETKLEYDSRGNLTAVVDPMEGRTTYTYNKDNKMIEKVDPEGVVHSFEYDLDGNLIKSTDGNGNDILYEYGDSGSGCSSCSSAGPSDAPSVVIYPTFTQRILYDKRGRKIRVFDDLSDGVIEETSFIYDDAGHLLMQTDKEGNDTDIVYDALGMRKTVTDARGGETVFAYDIRGNLKALTDAEIQTTRFEYDFNNRLVKETRPMGETVTYAYDKNGNLKSKVDSKKQKIEYTYDDAGKLKYVKYYTTTEEEVPIKTVSFFYDKAGRLTGYDDETTSATYVYDDAGRKLSESLNYGPFTKTHSYTYYKNGNKKSFTGPDGVTYGYLYGNNNELTGLQIPDHGFVSWGSYTWSRPELITLPGGTTRRFTYDALMRTKSIEVKDPAQAVLMSYNYNRDRIGNITVKQTEHGEYGYDYDTLYRLMAAEKPVGDKEAYTYDKVGNRVSDAAVTGNMVYNDNNELEDSGNISYTYDANGSIIGKAVAGNPTSVYTYNIENRLAHVEDGTGSEIASYYYDPFGRRLWKKVSDVKTYFYYTDEGLVAEFSQSGNVRIAYGYKPDSSWSTDPLFMKTKEGYFYYQNDHLGTPQIIISTNGSVVWNAQYDSFGKAEIDAQKLVNNLRFPGQYYDKETLLNYNWNRYYDFASGRYQNLDPIGFLGGLNFFTYASNNAVNLIDPLGLYCKKEDQASRTKNIGSPYPNVDKIGFWQALADKLAWEIVKVRFFKLPEGMEVPLIEDELFPYKVRERIYQNIRIVRTWVEVCYDDCTDEETGREDKQKSEDGVLLISTEYTQKYL